MAVLKKGEYLGTYPDGERELHMFSPEQIGTEGEVKYVKIGEYDQEFGSDRSYVVMIVNEEEQKLINAREDKNTKR